MEFSAGAGTVRFLRTALCGAVLLVTGTLAVVGVWWMRLPPAVCLLPPAIGLPIGVWYLPPLARSIQGAFGAGCVRIAYGVLWRRECFVPLASLRTHEVWATPLQRLCGCRTVVLRFAGGAAWLPLLDEQDAASLLRYLEACEEAV